MTDCPRCGAAGSVTQSTMHDEFDYGSGDSKVVLGATFPVFSCSECDIEFADHEAEEARHRAVCRYLGVDPSA